MRFMAEELKQNRAPARVMEWAQSQKKHECRIAPHR